MSIPVDADYIVRGYAPTNAGGHLLLETWHRGEPSKDVEVSCWRSRRARGEVGRIEVVHLKHHQAQEV